MKLKAGRRFDVWDQMKLMMQGNTLKNAFCSESSCIEHTCTVCRGDTLSCSLMLTCDQPFIMSGS